MASPAPRNCLRCGSSRTMRSLPAPAIFWGLRAFGYALLVASIPCFASGVLAGISLVSAAVESKLSADFLFSRAVAFVTAWVAGCTGIGSMFMFLGWGFARTSRNYRCDHCGSVMNRAVRAYARA